jgi:hypothetical protein
MRDGLWNLEPELALPWLKLRQGSHGMSAKEYREYGEECLGWAKTASSDKERDLFLGMADTWMKAAALAIGDRNVAGTSPKDDRDHQGVA